MELQSYVEDDENLNDLRWLAEQFGITKLLKEIANSPAMMGGEDIERLGEVLTILGVADEG